MGTSRRISSPWDIAVENLIWQVRQFATLEKIESESQLRDRFKRALEQAYTRGRQDGERMEREYPRSKANDGQ